MRRLSLSVLTSLVLLVLTLAPTTSDASVEPHPLIRRAVAALQAAKTDLQNAAHDYCGHRVEALESTNAALSQLQQAIACDSRRGSATFDGIRIEAKATGTCGGEPHPRIYAAINALGAAQGDLENAAHDYCGHRVEALAAVRNALAQLKLAIECDKR